ncbi:RNA polymerase sigma factor [Ruminococcus sp.]
MMQDEELIRLYVTRSERAIALTSDKYGGYCHTIAYQILKDLEDSEECVNDTYWKAWNVIPPTMPKCFKAFLGKITRNLSLHRWEKNSTKNVAEIRFRSCWMNWRNVSHPRKTFRKR